MPRTESLYPTDWLRIAEKDYTRIKRMLDVNDLGAAGFYFIEHYPFAFDVSLNNEGVNILGVTRPALICDLNTKKVGEKVEKDEILLEISTDTVDSEIPRPASGVVSKILVEEQKTVPVETVHGHLKMQCCLMSIA